MAPIQRQDDLRVAVIGAGAWGTALAALASQHCPTLLWARKAEMAASLAQHHQNQRYLPGIQLPADLAYTASLNDVAQHVSSTGNALIILGVPMAGLRSTCIEIASVLAQAGVSSPAIVSTCKGVDATTGQLPHQVMAEALQNFPQVRSGVLSGPSFAKEVAQGLPVALTIASNDTQLREQVTAALHGAAARIYSSDDVIGVETGGALKNVIAIACGVSDGLGLGANVRAALITRGLAEMTRLGVALGARVETFSGLTGLGDLVLTATGDLSRNRQVGLQLGSGKPLAEVVSDTAPIAEGVRCARAARELAHRHQVEMPITEAVCTVLFEGRQPSDAVSDLLARDPRAEAAGLPGQED